MDKTRGQRWWSLVRDRRTVDAALVLACLLFAAFAVKGAWQTLPRPVIAVAGLAGSAAQWPRRRWPQLAAVAGAASYALSGNPGPILVGLYSGASYAPRRHLWAVAVAGCAGFAGWSWIGEGQLDGTDTVTAAVATAFLVIIGVNSATRRALLVALGERAAHAESERLAREEQARAAERTRIAREMHDVLAHKVSLIALHAGALELTAGGDPARVQESATVIRLTAREALQELRVVLGVLQAEPSGPEPPDPLAAPFPELGALVESSRQAGQRVELHDRAGPLPPSMARVVYRVVQEGLTNAHRYAPGAATTVSVDRGGDATVTVTVHNGPGSVAPLDLPGSGSGLVGLAERIRLVGGALQSGPLSPDGRDGWRLRAVVPWLDRPVEEPGTAR